LIEEALVRQALKPEESSGSSDIVEIVDAPDVFISHSSLDKQVAKALITTFEAAFAPIGIRCSSVPGYKFTTGGDFRQQIRAEVERSRVFVALLTPRSLRAPEVLFEIGARWQTGKTLIPLIAAGAEAKGFQGPLRVLQAMNCENYEDLKSAFTDTATALDRQFSATAKFNGSFSNLQKQSVDRAKAYLPRLQIVSAIWSSRSQSQDVTGQLRERIRDDVLMLEATTQNLGDPEFGKPKRLKVQYLYDGEPKLADIAEHDVLTVPGLS
jgi:hypothetical protein